MGRYKVHVDHNTEFELDLAPLLAVMVKLVPVLLVSTAFVQMMIIETELPQVVQEAIQQQDKDPKATTLTLEIDKKVGFSIVVTQEGQSQTVSVPLSGKGELDYPALNQKLAELKKAHPETFKIEFSPNEDVSYQEIVQTMDEARKPREGGLKFPVTDKKTGKQMETDFMFPEVTFANMMDG